MERDPKKSSNCFGE